MLCPRANLANCRCRRKMQFVIVILLGVINMGYLFGLEAPTVHIPNQGVLVGRYLKMFRTQNIKAYLGIQYAKAERFAPPEIENAKWKSVYNASRFGPKCWQQFNRFDDKVTTAVRDILMNSLLAADNDEDAADNYHEDCLYLNIFVPDGSAGSMGYAVLVWLHGGDFSSGSPYDINPFQIVFKQKVIVVTVAYRLGIMGFFTTGDAEATGNFGLMDQSAALLWIRKNIAHFGGDAKRITIMGHTAGAVSVGLHLLSGDWSKNSFHKAIIMSGNILSEDSVRNIEFYHRHIDDIADIFGCNRKPTTMLMECLRRLDPRILLDNIPNIEWGPIIDRGFSNTSKGFIEDSPLVLLKNGNYHKVPIMLGITDMENVLEIIHNDDNDNVINENMNGEQFDDHISKIALDDIQKFNESDLYCDDLPIILDSINLLYKNYENLEKDELVISKYINFQMDRNQLAPLFLLADLLGMENDVYIYYFNIRPKTEFYTIPQWISVPKYFDQIFIWGVPYMNNNAFANRWNSTDKKIADIVMTMWANFIKTSNPTAFNIYIKWTTYTNASPMYLIINEDFPLQSIHQNYKINFWNHYYPKLLEFAVECCSLQNFAIPILPYHSFNSFHIILTIIVYVHF